MLPPASASTLNSPVEDGRNYMLNTDRASVQLDPVAMAFFAMKEHLMNPLLKDVARISTLP